jgi:multisubunit Na+/H+ antiporter MnhG subunit
MKFILCALALFAVIAFMGIFQDAHAQVMELDAIVVEGRIQRPQASYILQRASVDFGIQAKRRSFVHKIEETLEADLF